MIGAWRLLLDGAESGPWNMGVDDVLLVSAAQNGAPTLRFYTWRGAWLSVGYGQKVSEARHAACDAAGVGIVRRFTGGRAVLHGGDLTYAIAAPVEMLPRGLRASYGLVSNALCEALHALGVPAERQVAVRVDAGTSAFDCFAVPAADEICVGGRKLVGSAQRRAGGAVLQHGSIRVRPDSERASRAAGRASGGATSLRELGVTEPLCDLREACVGALRTALGGALESGVLTDRERGSALECARLREKEKGGNGMLIPSGISREPLGNR